MLFNINTLKWDNELLKIFGVPENILPKVVLSSGKIGYTDKDVFGAKIPITGMAGDQQAALFGQACFDKGLAKNTYGTGCFILMNTGSTPIMSNNRLLTTIAWNITGKPEYALEGSVFNAGAAVQWLRDGLGLTLDERQADLYAEQVPDTGGVYVVPAYTGLGAPYWDPYARGLIIGITRGTKRLHIIRATLESIAYQTRDVLEAMESDCGFKIKRLQADGGGSVNDFTMQFQSDITGLEVSRSFVTETTALGAAFLAGLAVGIWSNKEQIRSIHAQQTVFTSKMDAETRKTMYNGWKRAVGRSEKWER
jgi:glycerol kinase